ncbi:MAG: NEW3 domain-containing protein [Acidimicrobiia bacterium]|nr:NEW3 domain-containing protein [Acidimicrobiia bacterium]
MFKIRLDHVGRFLVGLIITMGALAVPAVPASAQAIADGMQLSTPYAGVAVEPGETASFPLTIDAPQGTRVGLSIEDVPEGWSASVRGGGFVVDEVIVDEANMPSLKLEVQIPADATEGMYRMVAVADSEIGRSSLELGLRVAEAVGGSVMLGSDFPVLRGPSDATFTFDLTLENQTPDDIQFSLDSRGPEGWTIDVKPSGEARATTLTVAGGGSSKISVDAKPPVDTAAGSYPLTIGAISPGVTVSTDLTVEVTGSYSAQLSTPDQRLNADVQAGQATDVPLVLVNTGSAPLNDVQLSATPPSGWDVAFDPTSLATVAPGEAAQLTAIITPSKDAVAGDYVVTLRASVPEAKANVELRTTVKTSGLWGAVGLGLIVLALVGLGVVFQRFGRR